MEKTISLKSSDGKTIQVSPAITEMSILIKEILQDSQSSEEIPLLNYEASNISKVVKYCELVEFKSDIPYPKQIKEDSKLEDIIADSNERNFIMGLSEKELQDLVLLANFLNIRRLLELCCVRIAYLYRAKEKNIEKLFGVPIETNEDVELAMKEQYPWAFEIDQERLEKLRAEDELDKGGN
eukprot:TRINITY_DN550_c0_g1_i13.p1 TRINITY_DN550_c0_g1~~TRINITY_DN550_c0_g1_i13.p1  ORF type:complete len:209 (-),score=88.49 TRINITY_DN550_c0_g1_i13:57-602(-)